MSLGRINGPMLQPNLERQGINIALDANLMYWDVNNRYVGINNTTPAYALDVYGNAHLGNLYIQGNTITVDTGKKLNLGNIANITISGGQPNYIIYTDGNGNLTFGDLDALPEANQINANVAAANVAIITANLYNQTYANTLNSAMVANLASVTSAWTANATSQQTQINTLISEVYTNANVASYLLGNITAGNISVSSVSANSLALTGNITGANIVYANNFVFANGVSILNGAYSNVNVTAFLLTNTGNIAAGNLAVSRNATVGNVISSGNYYGNILADVIAPYHTAITVFNSATAIGLPAGTNSQYPSANVAGYFRYNSSLSTVEFYNGSSWVPFTNTISDQQVTPDGVSNAFTLNQAASTQGLLVSINGTVQRPGTAYNVSGTTITFAEVPAITDIIDIRYIASATAVTLTGLSEDISTSGNITGNVIQANILSVSSFTANLIGNVVGNLTGNVRADTVYANTAIVSSGNITVNTTATIIDSFNSSLYRSAKYIISSTTPYDSQFAEVALTQFGSTVVTTAYTLLNTGANTVTFTANINGSTVNLLAQGTIPANQLRIRRTYFNV